MQMSAGVITSVKDVLEWDWENVWLLASGEIRNVSIEGDTLINTRILASAGTGGITDP